MQWAPMCIYMYMCDCAFCMTFLRAYVSCVYVCLHVCVPTTTIPKQALFGKEEGEGKRREGEGKRREGEGKRREGEGKRREGEGKRREGEEDLTSRVYARINEGGEKEGGEYQEVQHPHVDRSKDRNGQMGP